MIANHEESIYRTGWPSSEVRFRNEAGDLEVVTASGATWALVDISDPAKPMWRLMDERFYPTDTDGHGRTIIRPV